jgi:hypothetical protein
VLPFAELDLQRQLTSWLPHSEDVSWQTENEIKMKLHSTIGTKCNDIRQFCNQLNTYIS